MKYLALLLFALFCIGFVGDSVVDDSLDRLKQLIKRLGDNDSEIRESSQEKIIDLIRNTYQANKDIKHLIDEIKKSIKESKEAEITARLQAIIATLKKGMWIKISDAPLNGGHSNNSAHLYKNKLIIWGDRSSGKNLGAVFDLDKGGWTKMSQCPLATRNSFSTIIHQDKFIVFGGRTDTKFFNDAAIYDILTDKWEIIKECPLAGRYDAKIVPFEDKILIYQGMDKKHNEIFDDGAFYNPSNGKWIKKSPCPFKERINTTGMFIVYENKLITWGGAGKSWEIHGDGAIYDIETDKWAKIAECPFRSRSHFKAVLVNDQVFMWGGYTKKDTLTTKGMIYNIKKDSWTEMKDCPNTNYAYSHTFVCKNKIIALESVVMGRTGSAMYDISKNEWTELPKCPFRDQIHASYSLCDNKIIIWGGGYDANETNTGAIYSLDNNEWTSITNSNINGRYGHIALVWNNKLIIWGGAKRKNFSSTKFNDGAIYEPPLITEKD